MLENLYENSENDETIAEWQEISSECQFSEHVSCEQSYLYMKIYIIVMFLIAVVVDQMKKRKTEMKQAAFKEAVSYLASLKLYLMSHNVDDTVFSDLEFFLN